MIKLVIKEKEELMEEVAQQYYEALTNKPDLILGLATGSTPIDLYKRLVQMYEQEKVSFKDIKTFNLDEYCDLDKNDKNSYFSFMNEQLFSKVDIDPKNTYFPPTEESKIKGYEQLLEENPIDIQLLGIGSNGHIAFNEPGTSFDSRVYKVNLAQKTIDDNSRFFNSIEEVPKQAVSMGLANIMEAKKIILIAIGEKKADILKKIFENDEITIDIPATILKNHPDVTFYVDKEAAKYLKQKV